MFRRYSIIAENTMKKLLLSLILVTATLPSLAIAQYRHHGHSRSHWHHNHGWLVPALVGSTVVYLATRTSPIVVPQSAVVVVETPMAMQSNQVIIDGVVYEKQMMNINGMLQEVLVKVVGR